MEETAGGTGSQRHGSRNQRVGSIFLGDRPDIMDSANAAFRPLSVMGARKPIGV
jgi:hypothetical protein